MLSDNLHNEQELISLMAEGDENAFAKLYNFYRNKIYGIALKLTHSTAISEEIVAEVFLKIWLKRSGLKEISNFRAYLFAIARNEAFKVLKEIVRSYKLVLLQEEDLVLSHNDPEDYILEKDYNSLLHKAIDRLLPQQKKVYTLIRGQGLNRKQTAELLHIGPETVKFHLAQAMKSIRAFCAIHIDLIVVFSLLLAFARQS